MRRMFSLEQLQKLIEEGSLSPEQIQNMLVGKYVRIMPAPTSTTLTDKQIAQIREGVFINGIFTISSFKYKNAIITPAVKKPYHYYGYIISVRETLSGTSSFVVNGYQINADTKVFSIVNDFPLTLNGKEIPAYPSSTGTFTLKSVNGTLTWVADE